jgi:uncharacterized membrane protein required for colicin V production
MYKKVDKEKLDFWHKLLGIVTSLIKIFGTIGAIVLALLGYAHFTQSDYEKTSKPIELNDEKVIPKGKNSSLKKQFIEEESFDAWWKNNRP